jgi:hypothetical protein
MANDEEIGDRLNRIAGMVIDLFDDADHPILLCLEAGPGWSEPAPFQDRGEVIVYRHPSIDLIREIFRLREALPEEEQWQLMLMTIRDGRFDTEFFFPDELDQEVSPMNRSSEIVIERFGDKPVDYSNP